MMTFDDIVDMIDPLHSSDLSLWITHGWVRPQDTDGYLSFSQTDMARVRLIAECHYDLQIDVDAMPLVLSLLDQVYGLRRELSYLANAVDAQPAEIRSEILQAAIASIGNDHRT